MNALNMIGWDVNSEPHMLETVSMKGPAFFEMNLKERVRDWVLLSTCHRIEIYSSDPMPEFPELRPYHSYSDEEALMHLFRVSAGVESVSVGEQEILHQVKIAFDEALAQDRCSKSLSVIFRKAISVGKLVREKVPISRGKTSIPAHVGQMLSSELNAKGKSIAIVGSGKVATDLVKYAQMVNPSFLRVYARSEESLKRIERSYSIESHNIIDPAAIARDNDIIIAATSSKIPIFDENVDAQGKIIIDLGMPPNVSHEMRGCRLISLSDIEPIMRLNSEKKKSLIPKVEAILNDELSQFGSKLSEMEADNLIRTVFEHSKRLERNEVDIAVDMIKNGHDPEKVINQMADSLVNKVLAPQTLAIKKMIKENKSSEVIDVLQEFYRVLKGTQEKGSRKTSSDRRAAQDPPAQIPR